MRYRVPDLAPETWHTAEIDVEKSQFLAWVCHAPTTDAFDALLQAAKAAHPNASHHCTAFIAGPPGEQTHIGFSDDGEPGGTAGRPMFQALQGSQIGEIGCVVIRYFGGTKLGVGGLINAYRTGAKLALEASEIETRYVEIPFVIKTPYNLLGRIMRLISDMNINILSQESAQDVTLSLSVRASQIDRVKNEVKKLYPAQFIPTN